MSYRKQTRGYDPIISYTEKEIFEMYLAEGKDPETARAQAKVIVKEINRLNSHEIRLWDRVRKHEILFTDLNKADENSEYVEGDFSYSKKENFDPDNYEYQQRLFENAGYDAPDGGELKKCEWCQEEFLCNSKQQLYCSPKCRGSAHNHNRQIRNMAGGIEDGLKQYHIFERDNYTCRICGIVTPSFLLGKFKHNSPECAHIDPYGGWKRNNLITACYTCNRKYGHSVIPKDHIIKERKKKIRTADDTKRKLATG